MGYAIEMAKVEYTKRLDIAYKEIERLKKDLRSTVGGRSAAGLALAGQNIKLIEENCQLEKEKEWLVHHYAKDMVIDNDRLDDHGINDFKNEIIEEMQEALNKIK